MTPKSPKRTKRDREAKPFRDQLKASVGKCEICGCHGRGLDVHEICRGSHREKAIDKPFAVLVVCRACHDKLGSAFFWPEARQLAIMAEKRLLSWDLKAYLEITSPRAKKRIEIKEVVAYMEKKLLKVDEVAERMLVNRRTAQSWIDSGHLPAIDVRPSGAQRAMWRVQVDDLLEFAQSRKSAV